MPDGDACRPDGTLKDASEIEWQHSPSSTHTREKVSRLKRKLVEEDESACEGDKLRKAKVLTLIV